MLRSPELMTLTAAMGDYLRFRSALVPRLRELAILVTSREWTQQFEWDVHAREARTAGVSLESIDAIAHARRPDAMDEDEAALYDLCLEIQRARTVTDAVYLRAVERLGERAVVDAVGICGYYTMLAMVMNMAQTSLPEGRVPPLAPLPSS